MKGRVFFSGDVPVNAASCRACERKNTEREREREKERGFSDAWRREERGECSEGCWLVSQERHFSSEIPKGLLTRSGTTQPD